MSQGDARGLKETVIQLFCEHRHDLNPPEEVTKNLNKFLLAVVPQSALDHEDCGKPCKRKLEDAGFGDRGPEAIFAKFSRYLWREGVNTGNHDDIPEDVWKIILDYVMDERFPFFSLKWAFVCKKWFSIAKQVANLRFKMLSKNPFLALRRFGLAFDYGVLREMVIHGDEYLSCARIKCPHGCRLNTVKACMHGKLDQYMLSGSYPPDLLDLSDGQLWGNPTVGGIKSRADFFGKVFQFEAESYEFNTYGQPDWFCRLVGREPFEEKWIAISREELLKNACDISCIKSLVN